MSLVIAVKKLAEAYSRKKEEIVKVIEFLKYYGYLTDKQVADIEAIKNAISVFKEFYGFSSFDGEITGQVIRAMEMPRCSCPDVLEIQTEEYKWRKNHIKYYVNAYVNGLDKNTQNAIFAQAFNSWKDVCDLTFEQINTATNADIIISTGRGRGSNFDGPSGTLAWAQLPQGNNQQLIMKFDLDETWVNSPTQRGILLLNVAAHEFGHNLGLGHSKVQSALMAPYYSAAISKPQKNDDVPRIQSLYGLPKNEPTTPTPQPKPDDGDGQTKELIIKYSGTIDSISCDGFRIQKLS